MEGKKGSLPQKTGGLASLYIKVQIIIPQGMKISNESVAILLFPHIKGTNGRQKTGEISDMFTAFFILV